MDVAGRWADELVSTLRAYWTDPNPGAYFHGATACLSCLLVAGRHQALLEFLEMPRYPSWHYRRYGVQALLALGKKAEAVQYAGASRALNQPDSVIDQACEEILISSGLHEEAYQRYGLSAAVGNSYLARFRAVAKRYSAKDRECCATKFAKFECSFSAEKWALRDNEGQFKTKTTSLKLVVTDGLLVVCGGLLWFVSRL